MATTRTGCGEHPGFERRRAQGFPRCQPAGRRL